MSHYAVFETKTLRNQEVLLAALASLGIPTEGIEVHPEGVTLRDYDNKPLRGEKATIVVRKATLGEMKDPNGRHLHSYVDLGFARRADGTYAILADNDYPVYMDPRTRQVRFEQAVQSAYQRVNADHAVRTVLTRTIPGLKAQKLIPANATAQRETLANGTTRVSVVW
jgi:hypothetical protein